MSITKLPLNFFKYNQQIKSFEEGYSTLFKKYQDHFILHKENNDALCDQENKRFTFLLSTLPTIMQEQIKRQGIKKNVPFVNLSLLAYSTSHNNFLNRIDSLFSTFSQSINEKKIIFNNMAFLWVNFVIILLAITSIIISLLVTGSSNITNNYYFNKTINPFLSGYLSG